jgi:hypothetical protein
MLINSGLRPCIDSFIRELESNFFNSVETAMLAATI